MFKLIFWNPSLVHGVVHIIGLTLPKSVANSFIVSSYIAKFKFRCNAQSNLIHNKNFIRIIRTKLILLLQNLNISLTPKQHLAIIRTLNERSSALRLAAMVTTSQQTRAKPRAALQIPSSLIN